MTHPKDPRLNGWHYKSFNLNDKEHAEVVHMYETVSKKTGVKQKYIFIDLIKGLYEEVMGITHSYADQETNERKDNG